MNQNLAIAVTGHVNIQDDLGNQLLDQSNAIHPQNVARIIARALSNEDNFHIHRIAFGNGGTNTDAAYTITYKNPNDGQVPDVRTWDSRLYNETYSEIIDDNISTPTLLGTDPGSAGPNAGTRPGGGSNSVDDPVTIPHVSGPGVRSNELGLTSEIVITSVLNPGEPTGQSATDNVSQTESTESDFAFDEIGLYTTGAPAIDSNGSFDVEVGDKTSIDGTTLLANTQYSFFINVDGGGAILISFTTPVAGGSGTGNEILYGDLCEAINSGDVGWNPAWSGSSPLPGGSIIAITDSTLTFPSITSSQTYGFIRVTSSSTGANSTIDLSDGNVGINLWDSLNAPTGANLINPGVGNPGNDAGVQNDPVNSPTERERLLTHIIFQPIFKSAERTLRITYTITVSVARTQ